MPPHKDKLEDVFVPGGGNLEQIVYRTQYSDQLSQEYGFAIAIVRPYGPGHRRRVAMRGCDRPERRLEFPRSPAGAAWFEVPSWMEAAILKAAADPSAKEIEVEDLS